MNRFLSSSSAASIAVGVTLSFAAAGAQAALSLTTSPAGAVAVTDIVVDSTDGQHTVIDNTVIDTVYNASVSSDVTTFNIGFNAHYFGGYWNQQRSFGGGQAPGGSGSLLVTFFTSAGQVSACINGANSSFGLCTGSPPNLGYSSGITLAGEKGNLFFYSDNSFNKVVVSYAGVGAGDGFRETYSLSGAVAAVPEPETYAMMLAGLGAVGFMARRRRSR